MKDHDQDELPGTDWPDRILDRALHELHGERPPDLAAAVEARLGAELRQPERAVRTATVRRPAGLPLGASVLATAAAVAALLFLALWIWDRPSAADRLDAVEVELNVVAGAVAIETRSGSGMHSIAAGTRDLVVLRRSDRLHAAPAGETEIFFGPFGLVRTEPQTVLEVRSMDFSLKNGWVAAGSLTLGVVVGAASWHFVTQQDRAEAGEVLRLEAPVQSEFESRLQSARAEGLKLQKENDDLKRRLEELETRLTRTVVEPKAPQPEQPADPTAEAVVAGPIFDDERFADALREVDWEVMGRVAGEMALPLVELARILEEGGEMPMELAVQIAKLNMQLVEQLPAMMKADLPGAGPNGVYSHPLVVGNQLASLLASGGLSLSDAQQSALGAIVRHYSAENEGVHATASELELDKILAEVTMKDRMYDELSRQLTPEQFALVYPEGAGAYDGTSLFRSGLVWQVFARPMEVSGPADYASQAAARVGNGLGLEGAAAEQVQRILGEVAASAPAELWRNNTSPVERGGLGRMYRAGRTTRAAQTQQLWMRRILREVPLSPDQRQKLQQMSRVMVPLMR